MRALILVLAKIRAVASAQFVHQVLEARGQAGKFGAQALPQPFAHGVANRPAGPVIERFGAVSNPAHDGFRLRDLDELLLGQVTGPNIVSACDGNACFLVKIA
jgi:hypothetical protein